MTSFLPFPTLYTERLILRQLRLEDADSVFILRSDEGVNTFIERERATSLQQAKDHIEMINKSVANDEAILWVLEQKADQQFVGAICLWNISADRREAEIGYELLPQLQGRGYMQESIPIIIDYGFSKMRLEKIVALPHHGNSRSVKLLVQNGFVLTPLEDEDAQPKADNILNYVLTSKLQLR
jgi:ribosomal-protein-alanine N-acetyltransferase